MKVIKKVIIIIITICIIIIGYFGVQGYDMYKKAIETISIEDKISEIKNKKNYTKLDEIPRIYKEAVIAVENHRFHKHNGIDIIAIGRAVFNDIKAMSFVEGGSTITQQLAKNIYFTQEKKMKENLLKFLWHLKLKKIILKMKF